MRCSLRARYDDRIDLYGWDGEIVGYRLLPETMLDMAERQLAADLVQAALRPLDDPGIVTELARLRASCKTRAQDQQEVTLTLRVLAEECAEYPADVVVYVLRNWARRETFTPSLAELRDQLQRAARSRLSLAQALKSPVEV